jgi:hypothetical protein
MEVRKDISVPLTVTGGEDSYVLDPRYDFVRLFPAISHAILNVVTETGVVRLHTTEEQGRRVGAVANLVMVELDWIGEQEWETYLECRESDLDHLDFDVEE